MSAYQEMSTKPRPWSGLWILILSLMLFALTLTAVAMLEAGRAQSQSGGESEVFIVNSLWKHFKGDANNTTTEQKEEVATVERIARETGNISSVTSQGNNYYEEQRAIVVNSESSAPVLAQRQDAFGPPQAGSESYEQDPYYDVPEDYGAERYEGDSSSSSSSEETAEGRAAQSRPYDSYYAAWQYGKKSQLPSDGNNRKLETPPSRSPYPAYDDVYDYPMGFQPRPRPETGISKQAPPSQPHTEMGVPQVQSESTLLTVLKSLKQIWDLYQALMSAWNAVSERHQQSAEVLKKELAQKQAEKQRLRQQQQQKTRINSKKPPAMANKNKNKITTTTTTSTTSTTTNKTPSTDSAEESEEESTSLAPAKVEPRHGAKGDVDKVSSVRGLRQRRAAEAELDNDVGEGRYIKGDPLKGYYDFVITEGSYKFWAVFQVGTAILIIYSTFAAIYYSKVNPLTSDYDYTDYLGGGRSLSGGDDDFVDDGDGTTATPAPSATSRLMDWLPRTGHSLQFILDAIDKIPLDHDQHKEVGWNTDTTDTDKMKMR
ncbi:uncharacterized protein Dwil_GK14828 [Drosophila willistoni]|uniref:Uncharacterized protein n=1 Tax=Drosophila willistoni TaxID=7260 RepID=B4MWJ2_DROWI|nr:uncharacterized protein LOC6642667 [Drosophila willistoni]EDW76133.1 uncharacterized protein Dwil_GK14828 [Drosophila willistoni]